MSAGVLAAEVIGEDGGECQRSFGPGRRSTIGPQNKTVGQKKWPADGRARLSRS